VYVLYPETCGVRLEDMDALFGDATNAMGTPAAGTPALHAETDALVTPGSPVPNLDIRGRPQFGTGSALPGLDIDPPTEIDRKPRSTSRSGGGGIGGWFSWMIGRRYGGSSRGVEYEAIDQRGD
jgi:hypothetical protein